MGFLDKLRMANIFPKNPGQDRPFGMPDMNQGDDFMRKILPIADNLERSRNTRFDAKAQAEIDLYGGPKNPQPNRLKNIFGQLGINKPENVVYGGVQPNSPMQDRMNEQSDAQQAINLEDKNFDRGVMRENDVASAAKRAGDLEFQRAAMTKSGEDETARELAEVAHGRNLELEDVRNKESIRKGEFDAQTRANEVSTADWNARNMERVKGEEERQTWKTRGEAMAKTLLPNQQGNAFENKVQQLAIQHPELVRYLERNEQTGAIQIRRNAPPEIANQIRNYLQGQSGTNKPGGISDEEIDALINEFSR